MRLRMCALAFFVCMSVQLGAQQTYWFCSTRTCALNAEDSTFLVQTEKQLLATDSARMRIPFFRGGYGAFGFRLIEHWATVDRQLDPAEISKIRFRSCAELCTIWNSNADTCMVIGFQPMIRETREEYGSVDSTCWMHVPLYFYRSFLEEWRAKKLHELMMNSFASAFGANRIGDTLVRTVTFKPDSNEYLPQALYRKMMWRLSSSVRSGALRKAHNVQFTNWMSVYEYDRLTTHWDSTNTVEDPNNPGTWIIAPIKTEHPAEAIVMYEKWIPDTVVLSGKAQWPWPYLRFIRKACAYGLRYAGGKMVWMNAVDVHQSLPASRFNWLPYEESFRAERFERMRIDVESDF